MSGDVPSGRSHQVHRGRNIARGILRLATGHADGLVQFGNTTEAFLASLAPLVAFPLVGTALMLFEGGGVEAVANLLATLCALLAPPVLSFEAARLFGRADRWPRFATAFNWCQWVIPIVAVVLMLLSGMLMAVGLPDDAALSVVVLGLAAYGLWLHWFLARHGLALTGGRAALLVLGVNLVTVALVLGPRLLVMKPGAGGMWP